MPSPFPGIDPFFESEMGTTDFRHGLIVRLSGALNEVLPEHYVARLGQRHFSVDPDFVLPKRLLHRFNSAERVHSSHSGVTARMPNMKSLDPYREIFIEITAVATWQVVTVVELLSPANKNGGRGQYIERRQQLLKEPVNIVEIDLTRGGVRPLFEFDFAPNSYCFLLSPVSDRPYTSVIEWMVKDPVPELSVPVTGEDVPIQLRLSEIIETQRRLGRYEHLIHYDQPAPPPSFAGDDAEWVARTSVGATLQ